MEGGVGNEHYRNCLGELDGGEAFEGGKGMVTCCDGKATHIPGRVAERGIVTASDVEVMRISWEALERGIVTASDVEVMRISWETLERGIAICNDGAGELTRIAELGAEEEAFDIAGKEIDEALDDNQGSQEKGEAVGIGDRFATKGKVQLRKGTSQFSVDYEVYHVAEVLEPEDGGGSCGYGDPDLSRNRCDDCGSECCGGCDDEYRYGSGIQPSSPSSSSSSRKAWF